MLNPQDFAYKLELILSYHQLTASSFADKIGVQRSSISHLLSGRNKPGLEFVIKIVACFPEVDLYWFLMDIGSFPKQEAAQNSASVVVEKINKPSQESQEIQAKDVPPKLNQTASSSIDKVLVFYTDGTFKSYDSRE